LNCIQFRLANHPFQAHLSFELVRLAHSDSHWIHCEMNSGNWWWDMQDQLHAGTTIVAVICASDKTQLTNYSGNQHIQLLYPTIGNIRINIWLTPKQRPLILVARSPSPPNADLNTEKARHFTVGTVRSPLQNLDITGPGLKWNCTHGIQRHCFPLLAAWVGNYPEHLMIAPVSYDSFPVCGIPKCAPMGHSTCQALDNSRDQHVYS